MNNAYTNVVHTMEKRRPLTDMTLVYQVPRGTFVEARVSAPYAAVTNSRRDREGIFVKQSAPRRQKLRRLEVATLYKFPAPPWVEMVTVDVHIKRSEICQPPSA